MKNKTLEKIVEPLLKWYQENQRDLPWRHDITPYKTWVSEIMLQQTRVEAVKEYYTRFLKRLPTINDLAYIPDDELMKLWQGLGYYNRARNMKKMAIEVIEKYNGVIPNTKEEIIKLPGIGEYTAGAILSIAYQKKIACVDGNVLRVITRIQNDKSNIQLTSTKEKIKKDLEQILPDNVRDFNQSLMELGALVCLPNGEPKCGECPLQNICKAHLKGQTDKIPVKSMKKERKKENKTVLLIRYKDQILIRQRPKTGLLQGLFELPNEEGHLNEKEVKKWLISQNIIPKQIQKSSVEKHIFTHIEWNMQLYIVEVEKKNNDLWASPIQLQETYSLPTAFSKLLKYAYQSVRLIHPFPPIYDKNSQILILGTFPSPKSRSSNFYYSHPQNHFWKVIAHIFNQKVPITNQEKEQFLLKNHIALWDVIQSCEIKGAKDETIKNPLPNDLNMILKKANIKAIFTTGKKATELYQKLIYPYTDIQSNYLPSTSPANSANYTIEDLHQAYLQIMNYLGGEK